MSSQFTSPAVGEPKRVLITGAAGQIGYSLIPLVAGGAVLGSQTPVDLVLLDIPQAVPALDGIVLEIQDGAYPLLRSVTTTSDLEVAFKGTQVALMVGGFPRLPGMDRKDLLAKNAQIFVAAGQALDKYGDRDCKVLVVANPANTNCLIMRDNCPSIPAENFTCLTRLDHNRAVWQLAAKAKVPVTDVARMTIWGNHSNTMVPDAEHALIKTAAGAAPAFEALKSVMSEDGKDNEQAVADWIQTEFTPTVQTRGAEVLRIRQKSSAMSAANAVADHIRNWLSTVPSERVRENDWVSMGIVSQGQYGVQEGLVFSYPVQIVDGKIKVVEGLELSDSLKAGLKATEAELASERDIYYTIKAENAAANP